MKYEFKTKHQKRKDREELQEDAMVLNSLYKPNERVIYKNSRFTLKYAEVRDSELQYFAIHEKSGNPYFIPERVLAQ